MGCIQVDKGALSTPLRFPDGSNRRIYPLTKVFDRLCGTLRLSERLKGRLANLGCFKQTPPFSAGRAARALTSDEPRAKVSSVAARLCVALSPILVVVTVVSVDIGHSTSTPARALGVDRKLPRPRFLHEHVVPALKARCRRKVAGPGVADPVRQDEELGRLVDAVPLIAGEVAPPLVPKVPARHAVAAGPGCSRQGCQGGRGRARKDRAEPRWPVAPEKERPLAPLVGKVPVEDCVSHSIAQDQHDVPSLVTRTLAHWTAPNLGR
mmetsp:Transcript_23053/g.51421  ORF Transcript_23053/g.51421 Transcript_23053/m.51421 type:complete len:266 (+) Transcript_23053:639-1436(+)